jgi:hypothetical protein
MVPETSTSGEPVEVEATSSVDIGIGDLAQVLIRGGRDCRRVFLRRVRRFAGLVRVSPAHVGSRRAITKRQRPLRA